MFSSLFLQGMVIGVLVSIPMGPIGVLCVQRTLQNGRQSGLISGFGAATADSFFAAIAGFGLSIIANFFAANQFYIMLIGAVVLLYFGFKLFFTNTIKQARKQQRIKQNNFFTDFISVFFLTLSNPVTIIFFGVVFAGLGIVKSNPDLLFILIAGIFAGAVSWWLILSSLVNMFRKYFRLRILFYINKFAGVLIIAFGLMAMFNAFYPHIGTGQIEQSKILNYSTRVQDSLNTIEYD